MEKYFSLNKLSSDIFTEDLHYNSNTQFPSVSDFVYTAIKEANVVSANTLAHEESSFYDSLYRIKEVEKDISKNALMAGHSYGIERRTVNGLHESVVMYEYTNLSNTSKPSFVKLEEVLDESLTALSNYDKYATSDTADDYISFLKEEADKLDSCMDTISNDVLGIYMTDKIVPSNFIEEAYKLFRNGSKLESFDMPPTQYKEWERKADDFCDKGLCDSVESYNSKLNECISKLNKVVALLEKDKMMYNKQDEVDWYKKKLLKKLCKYATKYLAHTNIAYAMKVDATRDFLHPTNNFDLKGFIITNKAFDPEPHKIDLGFDFDDEDNDPELESMMLEMAMDDIKVSPENMLSSMMESVFSEGSIDFSNIKDAVVCPKMESYENAYSTYLISDKMNEYTFIQEGNPFEDAQKRMANAAGGFKTPETNSTGGAQSNNQNQIDPKTAVEKGTAVGKEKVEEKKQDNPDTTAKPSEQNKEGVITTVKNKLTELFEALKNLVSKMLFRISKAVGKYSALARGYQADTLASNFDKAAKEGKVDYTVFPSFKGNPETAHNNIKAFINGVRQKTARQLIDTNNFVADKYTDEYFFQSITSNNGIKGDMDQCKAQLDNWLRGNANNEYKITAPLSKEILQNMIDMNQSSEMQIGTLGSTINNMIQDAINWKNTIVIKESEELFADDRARESMASVLEEYFGEGYKAFNEGNAPAGTQQNVNDTQKKNDAIIAAVQKYTTVFGYISTDVGTIMHQLYDFNNQVLRRIAENKMMPEQNEQPNGDQQTNQNPAEQKATAGQQQQQGQPQG